MRTASPCCRRGAGCTTPLTLDIASAAPFALQWWTRRVILPLPSPLHVAPRCGRPVTLPWRAREHAGETREANPGGGGRPERGPPLPARRQPAPRPLAGDGPHR